MGVQPNWGRLTLSAHSMAQYDIFIFEVALSFFCTHPTLKNIFGTLVFVKKDKMYFM